MAEGGAGGGGVSGALSLFSNRKMDQSYPSKGLLGMGAPEFSEARKRVGQAEAPLPSLGLWTKPLSAAGHFEDSHTLASLGRHALGPAPPARSSKRRHSRDRLQGPPPLQKCAAFVWGLQRRCTGGLSASCGPAGAPRLRAACAPAPRCPRPCPARARAQVSAPPAARPRPGLPRPGGGTGQIPRASDHMIP